MVRIIQDSISPSDKTPCRLSWFESTPLANGQTIYVINTIESELLVDHLTLIGVSGNRKKIKTPGGSDVSIPKYGAVEFVYYDGFWYLVQHD